MNNETFTLLLELSAVHVTNIGYRRNDSLQDWQENIGKLCLGNSRLMFAVALAFTGPILQFVEGVRVRWISNLRRCGNRQVYRSHGCRFSVGLPSPAGERGFLESWNTTANKVESPRLRTMMVF